MRRSFVILASVFVFTTFIHAAEKKPEKEKLVPLYRFYAKDRNEHVYTHDAGEAAAWRKMKNMDEHGPVGLISPVDLPDTIHIWRAVRPKDGKHYHYSKAPGVADRLVVEDKVFHAYAWKKSGDGRIPVYSSTWLDGTDTFFDSDKNNVRKFSRDSKSALGVDRPEQGLVFYVYPAPDKDSDDNEVEPEKEEVSAADKAKAAKEKSESDEKLAAAKLKSAESLLAAGKTDGYRKSLTEIVEKYPDTKAAATAKKKLKQ